MSGRFPRSAPGLATFFEDGSTFNALDRARGVWLGRDAGALADGALRGGASAFIVESLIGAVDADGASLPYPPLHLHHMHLLPTAERLRFHYNVSAPAGPPVGYLNNVALERHGEWNHLGSTPVMSEAEPEGYGRLLSWPLDFDGELNDARPRGSPPLTWYLQIAVRWRPAAAPLVPVSVFNVLAIGPVTDGAQATFERYFWVPTAGMWLGVYSGALGFISVDGTTDLNVVIRTAVVSPSGVSLGAGGAVVTMSDGPAEWQEVLLKARPVMKAVAACAAAYGS